MANILIVAANPQNRDRLVAAVAATGSHAIIGDTLTTNTYPYALSRRHKQPDLLVVDQTLGQATTTELADHWHHLPTLIIDPASPELELDDAITLTLGFT